MKRILYLDRQHDFFGRRLAHGFINEASQQQWWDHWYHPFDGSNISSISTLLPMADGVILRGHSDQLIKKLKQRKIPHLNLRSKNNPADPDIPHADDALIGKIAQQEMNRLNVIHKGFIGYKNVPWSETRGIAYLKNNSDKSKKSAISYLELTKQESDTGAGIQKIVHWLKKLPKPAGIFASTDHLGIATLIACQIAQLEVPDQISVIGVDNNIHRCDSINPPLSSIDLHPEALGRHLAYLFAHQLGIIDDEQLLEIPSVRPPSLVVRQSSHHTNPYLIHYRKSIEWIYQNALQGPTVDELADACGTSRRALERAFKQNTPETPATIIRQERMRQIEELLKRDNVSQQHIAQQAHFPDISSLSNFVKRQTGKPPGQIRSQST